MTSEERLKNMTQTRIKRFINKLEVLAQQASELELLLPNGAFVESNLKGIAYDVERQYILNPVEGE